MDPVLSLVLIGVASVAAVGLLATWLVVRRPARALERRRRDDALTAATLYTPAPSQSAYGVQPPVDPCDSTLDIEQRLQAMRSLLNRGDARAASRPLSDGFAPTQAQYDDDDPTTAPMAWKPTLPPDEADAWEQQRADRARKRSARVVSTS